MHATAVGKGCLGWLMILLVSGCQRDLGIERAWFECRLDNECLSGFACVIPAGEAVGVCMRPDDGVPPTCDDGQQNGDEAGIDCGGSCPACAEPTCDDGLQNGKENGVDCGGDCPPCVPASCMDQALGEDETDIDCGGPLCARCDAGRMCDVDGDCVSQVCDGTVCAEPRCDDGIKNGAETGIDCGAASGCGPCALGFGCETDADCAAGSCPRGGLCLEQVPLAVGDFHVCAALDGRVRCWGAGAQGRLGNLRSSAVGDDELPHMTPPVELGGTVAQVAAGYGHTCALLDDGTVRCWGLGLNGELGVDSLSIVGDDETPASVQTLAFDDTVIRIAASGYHSCAIFRDGTVVCWGWGLDGRLGTGTQNNVTQLMRATPVDLPAGRRATALALGDAHSCALLDDGEVRCWGDGSYGKLGVGSNAPIGATSSVADGDPVVLGAAAAQLGAGQDHSCAVLAPNPQQLRCWGRGAHGQLGNGALLDVSVPNQVLAGSSQVDVGFEVAEVVGGTLHTCIRGVAGELRCWGSSTVGVLGTGLTEQPAGVSATNIDIGGPAVALASRALTACALRDDGAVLCWGFNEFGNLGVGTTGHVFAPPFAPSAVRCLSDGDCPGTACDLERQTCAVPLCDDGLANGLETDVDCGGGFCSRCEAGGTCKADRDCDSLVCGGGQCLAARCDDGVRNGNETGRDCGADCPSRCGALQGCEVGGDCQDASCVARVCQPLTCDNPDNCGGDCAPCVNGYGCLSNADCVSGYCNDGLCRVDKNLVAGSGHVCFLYGLNELRCWGRNNRGQLGAGHSAYVGRLETPVSPLSEAMPGGFPQVLAAGIDHTCGVFEQAQPEGYRFVRCWGASDDFRLGYQRTEGDLGDNEPALDGALVQLDGEIVDLVAGETHTCALLDGGRVVCFGSGPDGQLGIGSETIVGNDDVTPYNKRVNVGSVGIVDLCAGRDHTCAVSESGFVYCWGKNDRGQLGLGNQDNVGITLLPVTAGDVELGKRSRRGSGLWRVSYLRAPHRWRCALLGRQRVWAAWLRP